MNYIGSLTILDRGDSPAQAVIDKNTRNLAQRVADETRDELSKVMTRVHNIFESLETVEDIYPTSATMEYLNDLAELEAILKDEIKKRQYQQQVTVFIVGYQDVCFEKLKLMQQVNEFFMENSKKIDEEDWFPTSPEMDHDEVQNTVEESLSHAHELANRLAELNKEMVDYMANLAEKKANNRGRKKIEKALTQAKDEVTGLNEKLLSLQTELDEREEKVQTMFKQLESRNLEMQKYRTAAELAKQKIFLVQKELDDQKKTNETLKEEMSKLLEEEVSALQETHRLEMERMERQKTQSADDEDGAVDKSTTNDSDADDAVDSPENKMSQTKEGMKVAGGKSEKKGKSNGKTNKFRTGVPKTEATTRDNEGGQRRSSVSKRSNRSSHGTEREGSTTDAGLDLFDEALWSSIPASETVEKFAQYRKLSAKKILQLEEDLEMTVGKTKRKVATLKLQFQEHKFKWETERRLLIEQVDQSMKLQNAAEKEADVVMTQLEDFISEQERLEEEEEVKRQEILRVSSSLTPPGVVSTAPDSARTASPLGPTSPDSELRKLMQQTDDAKVQEMNSRLGTSVSAPPAVDLENTGKTPIEENPTQQSTEDDALTSAQSRASLRESQKARLEETKSAVADRRSKTPSIQLPTKLTVDDELIIDEDDDEMKDDFLDGVDKEASNLMDNEKEASFHNKPSTDDIKDLKKVNAIQNVILKGKAILEHPLLKEYLDVYESFLEFKSGLGKAFLEKDMMSAHQMTSDLETLTFDSTKKVMPQIEILTQNVQYVMEELSSMISHFVSNDRDPRVSSLQFVSREPTRQTTDLDKKSPLPPPLISAASTNLSSDASDRINMKELQQQYEDIKRKLEEDGTSYQMQLQRNTVAMMEMQETINELQRELSSLGKANKRSKSKASSGRANSNLHKAVSSDTSVMFTRLDSERNAKTMKKAVMDQKLQPEKYKETVAKMDDYVNLPAQRLVHLVKKYIHHTQMKQIEEKVRNNELDEDVYAVLDKMETLQNQRAKQWAETMDYMGAERMKLAHYLMDTFEDIEQESGIFLIKPMLSFKGRDVKVGQNKLTRPRRQSNAIAGTSEIGTFNPAPTPASNYRLVRQEKQAVAVANPPPPQLMTFAEIKQDGDVKVMGNGMTFSMGSPNSTWNVQSSQQLISANDQHNFFNTPRILELDINRMMIGQNNISTSVPYPPSEDRLTNVHQSNLRSYVTVNRPTAALGERQEQANIGRRSPVECNSAPPSSRKVHVSETDRDIPDSILSPSPLPPIGLTTGPDSSPRQNLVN